MKKGSVALLFVILAILGIVIPFLSMLFAIVSIVFALQAIKGNQGKKRAIVSLILSSVIVVFILFALYVL